MYVHKAYIVLTREAQDDYRQAVVEPTFKGRAMTGHRTTCEIFGTRINSQQPHYPDVKNRKEKTQHDFETADEAIAHVLKWLAE